jgi:hypothetical protein
MSKTETVRHTPGPWTLAEVGDPGDRLSVPIRHYNELGSVGFFSQFKGNATIDAFDANAHLIAAAPDLFEACKRVIAAYTEGKIRHDSVSESNALLAFICDAANKAEGRA